MSVYTPVSNSDLETFLTRYELGALLSYAGIEYGITNTNFWLETERGKFVLTLYEHHQPAALHYILGLQHHLAERGVACATPVIDRQHGYFSILNGKPAAINHRLSGEICDALTADQCSLIGSELARFHVAGKDYGPQRSNPCGDSWLLAMQAKLQAFLSTSDQRLLTDELRCYQRFERLALPAGPTHLDLFHDNCLFDGDALGGIIDFDYACDAAFLYDLAITLNDCCSQANGELNLVRSNAMTQAYQTIRPVLDLELDHFKLMLRLAACRFWLSRLHDLHFPVAGEMTFCKDPEVFRRLLLIRRDQHDVGV